MTPNTLPAVDTRHEPVAKILPSGEIARDRTDVFASRLGFAPALPWRVARSWPVFASHNRMVPSQLAAARIFPSGVNATWLNHLNPTVPTLLSPLRIVFCSPVSGSHSLTV